MLHGANGVEVVAAWCGIVAFALGAIAWAFKVGRAVLHIADAVESIPQLVRRVDVLEIEHDTLAQIVHAWHVPAQRSPTV